MVLAGLWVMLMLFCGLRRGEMMALEWSDVDLDSRLLHVKQVAVIRSNQAKIAERAKTEAGVRFIPICEPLFNALAQTPTKLRRGFVCLSAHGRQLSESAVTNGITTFCHGLERVLNGESAIQPGRRKPKPKDWKPFSFRAHDLRHTFATFLYDSGVDVKAAQYYLGHADIRMTLDLYTHLSKERELASRNQAVAYLNNLLDGRFNGGLPPFTANLPPT